MIGGLKAAESLKHFLSLLLDYQLLFQASSAQMSAGINGTLSAKLIRSVALLLLIGDIFFFFFSNVKQKPNQVRAMSNILYFQLPKLL